MMEKIDLDGTTKYFKTTKTDIVNKMTKSRIMFRGIKTSSGNQTAKLKSIQGITTFVCDEAEEWTNEDEFDKIMLSIRKKGIQNRIIIIMNPCDSNHFIYKKYIEKTHKLVEIDGVQVQISTHPNVLHIHTTYFDNIESPPKFLDGPTSASPGPILFIVVKTAVKIRGQISSFQGHKKERYRKYQGKCNTVNSYGTDGSLIQCLALHLNRTDALRMEVSI